MGNVVRDSVYEKEREREMRQQDRGAKRNRGNA